MLRWHTITPTSPRKFVGGTFLYHGITPSRAKAVPTTTTHDGTKAHQKATTTTIKVAAFDLDDTLIKTRSGRTMPIDHNDWCFLHQKVVPKLHYLHFDAGFKNFAIFSNQLLRNPHKLQMVQNKVVNVLRQTGIPLEAFSCFLAPEDDCYRKPCPLMFDYYLEEILKLDQVEKKKLFLLEDASSPSTIATTTKSSPCAMSTLPPLFFVGDAAGRYNNISRIQDHSCADRKFALNAGIKHFFTPEEFFLNRSESTPFRWSSTKSKDQVAPSWSFTGLAPEDKISLMTKTKLADWHRQIRDIDKFVLDQEKKNKSKNKNSNELSKTEKTSSLLILVAGFPRSGKSMWIDQFRRHSALFDGYKGSDVDVTIVTSRSEKCEVMLLSSKIRCDYIETWKNKHQQKQQQKPAVVVGVQLTANAQIAKHFNWFLGVTSSSSNDNKNETDNAKKQKLSAGELHKLMKIYEPLTLDEGYDRIVEFDPIGNVKDRHNNKNDVKAHDDDEYFLLKRLEWLS